MFRNRQLIVRFSAALALAGGVALAGRTLLAGQQLPSEPPRQFGASITGAFEGWFDDPDGTHNFLVGYLNRNMAKSMDVPIGPNNRIEPGGPDLGQPSHFEPGRKTGMFIVRVPKGFSKDERLTWTIVANGQSTVIPLRLHTDYTVSPFTDVAVGNKPPTLRFEEQGPDLQGPVSTLERAPSRTAAISAPLALTVWVADDARYSSGSNAPMREPPPPVEVTWSKFRGPGSVTFDDVKAKMEVLEGGQINTPFRGKATVQATFDAPGDYVLHVVANDYSGDGGGGEVCCWTFGLVKVTVAP
ncbi:MAG: hypothetical protein OEW19_05575 [Acidobacteriota bacterium]|nr:hypothetical protein [Acidobacteriota bacterium]